jgi:hypothetical protein
MASGSFIMFRPERIAQHFDQVVLHQQRLVLIDGQADVALGLIDDEVDAGALHAGAGHQLVDALEQPQARIGQVHRINRVLRHRDHERRPRHDLVVVVGDHGGPALALQCVGLAVELDEVDRRVGPCAVGHAVAHAGADEGQVRIAVSRLDDLLRIAQLAAQVHLVVTVLAALREQRREGAEELRQQIVVVVQPHAQALIEVARRGVERRIERAAVAAQDVAELRGDAAVDVDSLEAPLRRQGQRQFRRVAPNHA